MTPGVGGLIGKNVVRYVTAQRNKPDLEGVTHRNQQQVAMTVKENLTRMKTVTSTLV